MTFMLLDGHQSATASRPTQVSTRSASPAQSGLTDHAVARAVSPESASSEGESMPSMPAQPALSFQGSFSPSFPATFQATTPLTKAPLSRDKAGSLDHQQAAASIGISPGLLNCYVEIYRSFGGQMPVQQGVAGFERRFDAALVTGFAQVRQQVREGADIRSAMAALQLRQQDAKPSKTKKRKQKLEHLLELNAHLSQQVSELRSELSAIKQQTVHAHADYPKAGNAEVGNAEADHAEADNQKDNSQDIAA